MHFPLFHISSPHFRKFQSLGKFSPILAKWYISPCFRKFSIFPCVAKFPSDFVQFTCFKRALCVFCFPLLWPWCIYASYSARTGRLWDFMSNLWVDCWLFFVSPYFDHDAFMHHTMHMLDTPGILCPTCELTEHWHWTTVYLYPHWDTTQTTVHQINWSNQFIWKFKF